MRMTAMRLLFLGTVLVLVMSALQVRQGADAANTVHAQQPIPWGWFIRVKPENTETQTISFWVGTNKDTPNKWTTTWKRGDPATFWVGAPFTHADRLYVNAAVGDHGKNGWFCVDYQNAAGEARGIKHWDFDDSEDHDLKKSDGDDECGG